MKSRIVSFASAILTITYAHAANLTWDNGAATGNWNTTDANWTGAVWNNALPDNAIFGATAIGTVTLTEAITTGNITFNNPGYTIAAGTLSLSNSTITTAADAIISSVLAGSTGMTKSGAGTLELTALNTFTGGTTVNDGNLLLNSSSGSSAAVRGSVAVNTSATLTVAGGAFGGFGQTVGSKIDTLNVNGGSVVVSGNKMSLDAAFNLTGGTISQVSTGIIHLRNTALNSLASATASTVSSGLSIRADYGTPTLAIDTADGAAASDLIITSAIVEAVNGANPSANLVKSGDGTLELTALNTFTGGTTVNGGNLLLNLSSTSSAAVRGTVAVNTGATLTVSGGAFGGFGTTTGKISTLNVNGGSVVVSGNKMSLDAAFNLTGGTISAISSGEIHLRNTAINSLASATTSTISSVLNIRADYGTPTLTIDVADGAAPIDLSVNSNIRQSTSLANPAGNLVKTGAGTLVIESNCSYTGTTTVSEGTLAIDYYLNSDDLTVASGATWAGSGGIGGNVTVQTDGRLACAVASSAPSQVTRLIGGLLTLEAGTFVDLSAVVSPAGGTYVLLTATGGITGPLPTVTGLSGSLAINGNNLEFTVSASPYSLWAQGNITAIDPLADATPSGDPDGDGVNNFAEFALNGDPLNGANNGDSFGQTTNVPSVGNALILTFSTRTGADFGTGPTATADGVRYTVHGSLDLDAFASPATKVTPAIVPSGWPAAGGSYEYHTFRLDASTGLAGKGFLRLKTEQQ